MGNTPRLYIAKSAQPVGLNHRAMKHSSAFFRGVPVAALAAAATMAVVTLDLRLIAVSSFAVNYWWVGNVGAAVGVRSAWLDLQRILFSTGAACGSVLTVWLLR